MSGQAVSRDSFLPEPEFRGGSVRAGERSEPHVFKVFWMPLELSPGQAYQVLPEGNESFQDGDLLIRPLAPIHRGERAG